MNTSVGYYLFDLILVDTFNVFCFELVVEYLQLICEAFHHPLTKEIHPLTRKSIFFDPSIPSLRILYTVQRSHLKVLHRSWKKLNYTWTKIFEFSKPNAWLTSIPTSSSSSAISEFCQGSLQHTRTWFQQLELARSQRSKRSVFRWTFLPLGQTDGQKIRPVETYLTTTTTGNRLRRNGGFDSFHLFAMFVRQTNRREIQHVIRNQFVLDSTSQVNCVIVITSSDALWLGTLARHHGDLCLLNHVGCYLTRPVHVG